MLEFIRGKGWVESEYPIDENGLLIVPGENVQEGDLLFAYSYHGDQGFVYLDYGVTARINKSIAGKRYCSAPIGLLEGYYWKVKQRG